MRLIDADALLEMLGDGPISWTDTPEEIQAVNDWREFVSMINDAPTVDDWISVEDKMPEEGTWVLVCEKDGFMFVDVRESGEWKIGVQALAIITHWTPLPKKPPKEVSKHAID